MLPFAVSNGEVILIVVLVVAPIAALAFAGSGAVYREIGREMLEAKAYRQRERGETPLDVDAELRRISAPAAVNVKADPALVEEVRQLVIARNARRERQGKEPLDVDAEIARQLRDLEGLGQ